MYMAKANGKSGFAVFDPGMHAALRERNELSVELKRAVELDQLRLVYQPIIDLANGRFAGVEALVRWQHPDARPDRPGPVHRDRRGDRRDPVDRALGPARDLRAGRSLAARGTGPERRCSSASTSRPARSSSPASSTAFATRCARPGSSRPTSSSRSPRRRCCRATPATIATLAELRALGVRTVIDDFGTGYFSLSHLRQFPIDILKIAGEFVQDADADPKSPALARAIIAMGRSMQHGDGRRGDRDPRAGRQHAALGCTYGQGYYFSYPLSAGGRRGGLRRRSDRQGGSQEDPASAPGTRPGHPSKSGSLSGGSKTCPGRDASRRRRPCLGGRRRRRPGSRRRS